MQESTFSGIWLKGLVFRVMPDKVRYRLRTKLFLAAVQILLMMDCWCKSQQSQHYWPLPFPYPTLKESSLRCSYHHGLFPAFLFFFFFFKCSSEWWTEVVNLWWKNRNSFAVGSSLPTKRVKKSYGKNRFPLILHPFICQLQFSALSSVFLLHALPNRWETVYFWFVLFYCSVCSVFCCCCLFYFGLVRFAFFFFVVF